MISDSEPVATAGIAVGEFSSPMTTLMPPYVKRSYGPVYGVAVLYAGAWHEIKEGFRDLVGGKSSYSRNMEEAIMTALSRMYENAARAGASAVIGVRIVPYMMMIQSSPVFVVTAYGEAADLDYSYRRLGDTG